MARHQRTDARIRCTVDAAPTQEARASPQTRAPSCQAQAPAGSLHIFFDSLVDGEVLWLFARENVFVIEPSP